MLKGTKKHQYLICIDSDGTIMDTMTIKHVRCFGPCFIETFGIKDHVEDILTHWNNTNLYTLTRGINRFQGLKEILEYIDHKYEIHFDGCEVFYKWVEETPTFSVDLLKNLLTIHPDNFVIAKAIEWSKYVNESITKLPPSYEFKHVKETLEILSAFADLLGVSSANKDAVNKEWKERGLAPYFMDIACQDVGSKSAIISEAKKLGYDNDKIIMIGDAVGDETAATNNNVYFYPIIPTKEVECWDLLKNEISDIIKNGDYKLKQEELMNDFHEFLKNGGK